jgi:hypothetical protein
VTKSPDALGDVRLLALHGLRLKGFTQAVGIGEVFGLDQHALDEQLTALVAGNLVQLREGKVSGYSLTPAGRAEHARLIEEELALAGARAAVEEGYRRFLDVNDELLGLCTEWQVRDVDGDQVLNDHLDDGYDHGIVQRLVALDRGIGPVCADLGNALSRLSHHGVRLRRARQRVEAGDREWFTAPMLASYHTVWFELHEDLLVTLGRERSTEQSKPA